MSDTSEQKQYYHIAPDGFAYCGVCLRGFKGTSERSTLLAVERHLFIKHNIDLYPGDSVDAPTVIPWDRRGNGMLTSMDIDRTNSKLYTHGASNVKAYRYNGTKVVPE